MDYFSEAITARIIKNADIYTEKTAIVDCNKKWTYGILKEKVYIAAEWMIQKGAQKNNIVMLQATNFAEFIAFYYGIHFIGAICLPFKQTGKEKYIQELHEKTNACFIIMEHDYKILDKEYFDSELENRVNKRFEGKVDINKIEDILFTSGTTGIGKGVMLTASGIIQAMENIKEAVNVKTEDTVLLPLPLHHSNAIGTMRTYLREGGTLILLSGLKDINLYELMMNKYHCTGFSCSPVILEWVMRRYDTECKEIFSTLRYIEIGTAPITAENRKKIRERFNVCQIFINYGATEAPRAIYMNIKHDTNDHSVGRAIGDYEVALFDDNNTIIVARNEMGQLGLKGKALMTGYYQDDKKTKQVLVNGYFLTGDIAIIDDDSNVTLKGRAFDIINIGGEKVYPEEIENMIRYLPEVEECACIGIVNERMLLGQKIIAFIKCNDSYEFKEESIKKFLYSKLDDFKIPYKVIKVDEIPRNTIGKIDRKILKRYWEDGMYLQR